MNEPIAYLNGQLIPVSQAALSVFDLGVVAGAAATEMVRTFRHQLFLLDQHLDRLEHSLNRLRIDPKIPRADLNALCQRIASDNCRLLHPDHDLGLVVFVTAGQNLTYLGRAEIARARTPTVCIHTFPLPFELWADKYSSGLHLVTTTIKSIPDDVLDASIKHRNRLHWHLAEIEAKQTDPAAMALLTDQDGYLTEAAAGNLCVVEGATILTPERHVLRGVSRDHLAELAPRLGLTMAYTRLTVEDLARSTEALLTSTPPCLLPVTRFNGQEIGSGRPGPVFQKLLSAWSDEVGLNIAEQMRSGASSRATAERT